MILHKRYTDVKNGKLTPEQFLQEAKWDPILSKHITNFDTFESAVNIFKSKGLLFETSDIKNNSFSVADWRNENSAFLDTKKGDVDSAHVNLFEFERGWRYELKLSGKCDDEAVLKAKAKAVKNLEKDAIHYTKLEMGELAPDDSNTGTVDVSKGQNKVDEKNAAKPVKVKEQDTDAAAKAYLKTAEEKGKAPKKVELNEGLKLPASIVSKIEQAKDWIGQRTKQDKEKPKYKAALNKLEDVLSADAEGIVKTLKSNIEKVSPEFPNQKSGADFRARLNDIYAVYESLNKANLLDEKDEDYLPAVIANPIIEALRAYVAFVRDNDLSDSYKYLKEDAAITAGANGLSSLLQKVTDINLGASQPVSKLKDAIEQVGGGNFEKGLDNLKGLFKGNGGGTPDQQVDLLKGLVEKGAADGSKLADIFNKAENTFGSAKDAQKLFSIASPDKELIISDLQKVVDEVPATTTPDTADALSNIAQNILGPLGITVAIGAAIWGAAELKKRNDSRLADLNKLYKKLEPLTDREAGDSVPQDKDADKADEKPADKQDDKDLKDVPTNPDGTTKPIELSVDGDPKAEKPAAKEKPKAPSMKAKPGKAAQDAEEVPQDEAPKDGEDNQPAPKAKTTKKSVKAKPFDKNTFKDKPDTKVVGIALTSDLEGEVTKFKSVKFGLDQKVYEKYKTGKDLKLRNSLGLIASKVKSSTTELSVDLTGMSTKEIETASKGDVKVTKAGKLKEEIELMWESSELDNMVQSHANSKNPLVTEDCGCEDPKNKVVGGLGDKLTASDVDADELAMGLTIEGEHTEDPEIAMEIALDHLAEDPQYYSKMKSSGLEEGVNTKLPPKTKWPFYIVQGEKYLIAGYNSKGEATDFFRDYPASNFSIKTLDQVTKITPEQSKFTPQKDKKGKKPYYEYPQHWRSLGEKNKFTWFPPVDEAREELMEVLRGMVKKSLLKGQSLMQAKGGPAVDRDELKNLLAGVDWPPVGQPDNYDNSYRTSINQEKIMGIKSLIDRMGQEGIDLYNEYAPEGCKWGQKDELFSMQEESENMIRQDINDMEDLDPKDLAKEVLDKGFPEGSIKNKAAALILGNAIKNGEKDEQVKKAFMMLSDKLKK